MNSIKIVHESREGTTFITFSANQNLSKEESITLQLDCDFESGFPSVAQLEFDISNNTWKLCGYFEREIDGKKIKFREWLNSTVAEEIALKIVGTINGELSE